MTIFQSFKNLLRCGLVAGAYLGTSLLAHAVAPNAVNDDLTSSPVSQNQITEITGNKLTDNDTGDGKSIKSVTNSAANALVSWNNGSKIVTYDPRAVTTFIALDSGASSNDTFTYVLQGTDGPDATGTVTVKVNGVNDLPTITGISGTILSTNDKDNTNTPFTGVDIKDPDTGEVLTIIVSISPAASGSFSNATDFVSDGSGNYTFTGSAANATTKVAALNFVPAQNRVAPTTSADTTLTVSVADEAAAPVSASRTVSIQSVNDEPVVTAGTNRNMNDNATLTIFSNVALSDPDVGQNATVTVTFNANKGSFSGGSFNLSGPTSSKVLTLPAQDFASAQAALRALVFTPTLNQVKAGLAENLGFSIQVSDGITSGSGSLTVSVLSVNDPPVLSPATVGPFTASAGSTITPFANVTLTDADFDDTTQSGDLETPPGDSFTATITLDSAPPASGGISSSAFILAGASYTYAGTRSQVETAIRSALYVAPASTGAFKIKLSVKDSSGATSDVSNEIIASVSVTQPVPGMTGLVAGQQLADNAVIFPFASASFSNFGGTDRLVEIRLDLDAKGSFDNLGPFVKSGALSPFVYSMIGNSVSATDAIRGLRFRPTPNRIEVANENVTFSVLIKSATGEPDRPALSTDTLVVNVVPFNDAPAISGSNPGIRINDDETASPFATMSVADPDEGGLQQMTVNITLIGENPDTNAPRAGGGELETDPEAASIPGVVFTQVGTYPDITYTIVGNSISVTTFLRALVFKPEDNRNAIGKRETIRFTVMADDKKGGTAQNQTTTVIVTSVNGAPQINDVPLLSQQPFAVPASSNGMAMPFTGLEVTDEESITFTITLDNTAKGSLSAVGFSSTVPGIYSMSGTPDAITAALKTMVYTLKPTYSFPAGFPGLTTFTLTAADSTNSTVKVFTIFIRDRNVAHIVTSTGDGGDGSLREAIGLAGNGDMIVFDFPADEFPVTIALDSPLTIDKNLSVIGSGVDQLTISGQGSTGLFSVVNAARLTVEQLTFKDGAAGSYGGAVAVDTGCALIARYCEFSDNTAGQYGGAIDVFDGELVVENCLFLNNAVTGSIAGGGGAISIYTSLPSSITNSTFAGNRQENGGSVVGGGALYAQNADLAQFFNLQVEHCTFFNNDDAKLKGSAVLSAAAGMKAHLRNNIFNDIQGQVLDVLGGGRFVSKGGNIATDATDTTYTGSPQNIILLDHPDDEPSTTIPMLDALADNSGATRTFSPKTGGPAIDTAIAVTPNSDALGNDQRGFWRETALRDVGAAEAGAFKRVNINEIFVGGGAATDFIEFYNPRDSETLNMAGLTLWIDGNLRHTFGTQVLAPGAGFAWFSTVDLDEEKGLIELRNANGQRILRVDYVASFAEKGAELVTTGQSINRYPRYEGGFLPHQRVVKRITGEPDGDKTSPGEDVDGSELGGGNAPPIAVIDADPSFNPVYAVFANQTLNPNVLANDIEFDRTDTLKITEIMPLTSGSVLNAELFAINTIGTIALSKLPADLDSTTSPMGASVTINPDKRGITYDPSASPTMIALHKGETLTDIWAYTIRDFDESDTPQSRGVDAAKQEANIIKATTWFAVTVTGVNEAPEPMADSAAAEENQAIRLLSDPNLLAPSIFDFGDLAKDFKDFDAMGNPVTLLPPAPTVALLANDDDVDSDDDRTTLVIGAVHTTNVPTDTPVTTSELGATVKLDIRADRRETSIVYDPRSSEILNSLSEGEIATDSFYYSVFDRHGDRGVAKVTITITGVNDVPKARNDGGFVVNENSTLAITGTGLLANDTDPDQDENDPDDVLSIVVPFTTESALGAILLFDGTTITYDPRTIEAFESLARNETLTDTFSYTVTDAMGGTSTATVTVVVEGRNDAPVAADDLLKIWENQTTLVSAAAGLLANDVDVDINGTPPDDDPWVLPQRNFTTPMGANLNINPNGSFRYDANSAAIDSLKQGELAVELFPYTVIDNFRTTATDDTFKVLASSVNMVLPVLLNDIVAGASSVAITGYSADDEDPSKLVIESPNHSLRDGQIIRIEDYQGGGNYNGVHPVIAIDRDHFSVGVPFVDDPAVTRGAWIPWFAITNIGSTDKGGVISFSGSQSLIYTPAPGFYGRETFTYTIKDGVGGQDVAKVAVDVILPQFNGFLSASDDRFQVGMGGSGVAVDVLANDGILPANGASLTITGIAPLGGASGNLEILNNGKTLAYTPADPTFTGTESFTYTVTGGGSDTAEALVTFEVADRSNLLDGNQDDFFVVVGSSDNLLDVLANDPALPAYPVTSILTAVNGSSTGITTSSGGTVAISGNKLSYTPSSSILTDTFTYTARDASGATTTKTVRVRVVPATGNFYATDDHYIVIADAGSSPSPVLLPVLLNDGIVQNAGASLSIVNVGLDTDAPPDVSRVSIANGNSIRYTPPVGATSEIFTYETSIGTLERREATIRITVIDRYKTVPAPKNDFFHVAKDSGAHTLEVLKNDVPYPAAGWQWKIIATTSPDQGGTLGITGGTALSYEPKLGFFGTETFSYAIEDISKTIYTATVTIKVGGLITAPDQFAVLQDSAANPLPVLVNDDLLDTYAADYTISSVTPLSAAGGVVAIAGSGPDNLVLYTPLPGFSGEDSFTYTVVDRSGGTRDETVSVLVLAKNSDRDDAVLRVEITGVNDLPILTGMANGAITDKQTINPFATASITDLDEAGNQQQTVVVSFNEAFGTVVAPGMTRISAGVYRRVGTPAQVTASLRGIVFTPRENFIDYIDPGQAGVVFNLSITDGYIPTPILSATTITVTPVNDAPFITSPIPDLIYHVNAFPKGIYLPLHFADVDDDVRGGQLIWTVAGNTKPSLFSSVMIDPVSRMLVLTFAPDQAGVSDITVRGTDRGLLFVETTFRVTVEGPPVVVLAEGQTKPPAATFVSGSQSGFRRDYKQSFRVMNPGTLPVSAFIVHVSDLNQPVDGITVHAAAFSTNENGTPSNLQDDALSSAGVTILRKSTYVYDVKYDVLIPPGQSVVVHLTYRVSSIDLVSIRPTIRISLSTPNFTGDVRISKIELGAKREVMLTFNIRAGRDYRLEHSPDLKVWSPWLTAIPKSDFPRAIQFIDDGLNTGLHPSELPKRFYRLVELPAP